MKDYREGALSALPNVNLVAVKYPSVGKLGYLFVDIGVETALCGKIGFQKLVCIEHLVQF